MRIWKFVCAISAVVMFLGICALDSEGTVIPWLMAGLGLAGVGLSALNLNLWMDIEDENY